MFEALTRKWLSLRRPIRRGVRLAVVIVLLLSVVVSVIFLTRSVSLSDRLEDVTTYIARSARSDFNQAAQALSNIRNRGDASGEAVSVMKRSMYAAYRQSMCLAVAGGPGYELMDAAAYNAFQTAMGEYERLAANGQSTAQALAALTEMMDNLGNAIDARFDGRNRLLPAVTTGKISRQR